ncbi:hypothetical protein OSSY52_04270 [Tepiditoga spiralis]|uniref:site-specific DNA-methyltransferase (adenine-specific) n=1 Tax=Tepiditoga spiralis TaxID=2108365 RepID=A0A7G1G4W7_9BACT|nr:N-6 DNA methylase [Tepiditoga spiralis]BBE30286.1 hypothetical protein OSSY52_04270 [Tepiditoga spiralis]
MYKNLSNTIIKIKSIIQNDLKSSIALKKLKIKDIEELVFTHFNSIVALKIMQEKFLISEEYTSTDSLIYEKISKKMNLKKNSEELYYEVFQVAFNELYQKIPEFFLKPEISLSGYALKKIMNELNLVKDWNKDDILGWCYQYYNDDVRENNKSIAIQSQFYTPEWIIEFLVDNTLTTYYSEINKYTHLKEKYNIIPKKNREYKDLSNISILDPACGSGHFLIKSYDRLIEMYEENGISSEDASKLIIENNLFGLDVDKRAIQTTKLILKLKALENNCFETLNFNIHSISDDLGSLQKNTIFEQKFDIVLSNPPYTDSSNYSKDLKEKIFSLYTNFKKNLYTCFIKKNYDFLKDEGLLGMITPQTFMFISSYQKTREFILNNMNIRMFVQFGLGGVFNDALVDTAAYIMEKSELNHGTYIDLTKSKNKKEKLFYIWKNKNFEYSRNVYYIDNNNFKKIPGFPFAYWMNQKLLNIFSNLQLKDIADVRQGIATGDNKRFLRYNWEVAKEEINKKWIPYSKGGPYNMWYGNLWWVIAYDDKNKELLKKSGNKLPSRQYYFREGITYSMTTSKGSTFRYLPKNFMFDCKGSSIFFKKEKLKFRILTILNSTFGRFLYKFIAGSVDLEVGDLKKLPIHKNIIEDIDKTKFLDLLGKILIIIKKQNLDIYPIELHYKGSPLHQLQCNQLPLITETDTVKRIKNFIKKRDSLDTYLTLFESIADKLIFELYNLNEKDIKLVLKEMSTPVGWLKINKNHTNHLLKLKDILTKTYLKEFKIEESEVEKLQKYIDSYIEALKVETKKINTEDKILKSYYKRWKIDYDNQIKKVSTELKLNPLIIFEESIKGNVLSRYRVQEYLFLAIDHSIKKILKESEYGFLDVEKTKEKIKPLSTRIMLDLEKVGITDDFFSSFTGKSIEKYLITDYIKSHKKLYKNAPIIWKIDTVFLLFSRLNSGTFQLISKVYIKPEIKQLELKRFKTDKDLKRIEKLKTIDENLLKLSPIPEKGIKYNLNKLTFIK